MTDQYYQKKLKEKEREITDLRSSVIRLQKGILSDPNFPSWFYGNDIDNQTLHVWIKERDPGSKVVRYLYSHFGANKKIFDEMVNSDSPFFVPSVKKALSNILPVENELVNRKREIEQIRDEIKILASEKSRMISEKSDLSTGINDLMKKHELLTPEIETLMTERNILQAQVSNLRSEQGMEKITNFLKMVSGFVQDVENKTPSLTKSISSFLLNREQVVIFRKIHDVSIQIQEFLQSEPFIDMDNAESEIVRERERINDEMELVRKNLDALLVKNPEKNLQKIAGEIEMGTRMLEKFAGKQITPMAVNSIKEYFDDAGKRTDILIQQINNIRKGNSKNDPDKYNLVSLEEPEKESVPVQEGVGQEKNVFVSSPLNFSQRKAFDIDILKELNDQVEGQRKGIFRKK